MWFKRHARQANAAEGIARLRGCALGGRNGAFWAAILAEEPLSKGEPKIAPIRNRMPPEEMEIAKKALRDSKSKTKMRLDGDYEVVNARREAVSKMLDRIKDMHPDDADEICEAWAEGDKGRLKDLELRKMMRNSGSIIEENKQNIGQVMDGTDNEKKKGMILMLVGNWCYFPMVLGRVCELPKDMQMEIIVKALRAKSDASIRVLPLICEQEERHYGELYAAFVEFMNDAMVKGRLKIGIFSDIDIEGKSEVGAKALSFLPAMSETEQLQVMKNALCSKHLKIRAAAIMRIPSQPEKEQSWMRKLAVKGIKKALKCEYDDIAGSAFELAILRPEAEVPALVKHALRKGKNEKVILAAIAKIPEMRMPEKMRKSLCKEARRAVERQKNSMWRTALKQEDLRKACEKMPVTDRTGIIGG